MACDDQGDLCSIIVNPVGYGSSGGGGMVSDFIATAAVALGLGRGTSTQSVTIVVLDEMGARQQIENQKTKPYPGRGKKYQYWEANREGRDIIVGKGLTVGEASLRVSAGDSIMCANQYAAIWILILNGYFSAVGPERHGDDSYYYHYHPNRNTHTHIWYYN